MQIPGSTFPIIMGFDLFPKEGHSKPVIDSSLLNIAPNLLHARRPRRSLPRFPLIPKNPVSSMSALCGSPAADLVAGKRNGTAAIMGDGSHIVAPAYASHCKSGPHEFIILGVDDRQSGKFEVTVIQSANSIALTWINADNMESGPVTEFVLWYFARHTTMPNIEVHNILPEELLLSPVYADFPANGSDENLRHTCAEIAKSARARLEQRNWILAT